MSQERETLGFHKCLKYRVGVPQSTWAECFARPPKLGVVGSNPAGRANFFKKILGLRARRQVNGTTTVPENGHSLGHSFRGVGVVKEQNVRRDATAFRPTGATTSPSSTPAPPERGLRISRRVAGGSGCQIGSASRPLSSGSIRLE